MNRNVFTQRFQLIHEIEEIHVVHVSVQEIDDGIELCSIYESGNTGIAAGSQVACWPVTISLPVSGDAGHVWIGNGRIDIEVPELRGLGLGSLFMWLLITWIQQHPNLPVVSISLSEEDARSSLERDRRNRFYERLGFTFDYQDDREWGTSNPIHSHDLKCPEPKLKNGWRIEPLGP